MSYSLYCGDCLEEMRNIPNKSVDLILCDLPYGFTDCEWDKIIPFEPLWKEYKRVLKIRGIVVLFGNQPFTSSIINSNIQDYSHMWYWKKNYITGSLLAKQQPLLCIEDIIVFKCDNVYNNNASMYKNLRNYFYDELAKSGLKQSDIHKVLGNYMHRHYFCRSGQFNIPTAENYKKLQTTGFFNRTFLHKYLLILLFYPFGLFAIVRVYPFNFYISFVASQVLSLKFQPILKAKNI